MSLETAEFLNGGNILVGYGERPWWTNDGIISAMLASGQITKSPLYDGPVPMADARDLFAETIRGFEMAALKEIDPSDAVLFMADGTPYPYRVVVAEGRQLVGPEGRDVFYLAASDGYDTENHQFGAVLLDVTAEIIGDSIDLQTAGRLRDGAQAFVTVGVPDTFSTPEGIEFRPHLTAASSFDGKVATQWARHYGLTVCDNTMRANLASAAASGQVVKVKHTRHSFIGIANAREALQLIETGAEEFAQEIATLCATPVSGSEWESILNELVPYPTDSDGKVTEKGRGFTMAASKRDTLQNLLQGDDRVAPWAGTAFGVLQAFNTWNAHESIVRGNVHRAERQYENLISGKTFAQDADVLATIAKVTERELVLA